MQFRIKFATHRGSGIAFSQFLAIALMAACSGGSKETPVGPGPIASPVVASVSVAGPPSIEIGDSAQLTATARDETGTEVPGRTVTWNSSAPGVASVSNAGIVRGIAVGSATILATIDGKRGSSSVEVGAAPVVASVSVVGPSSIEVGDTAQVTATARDATGTEMPGKTVSWSSSAPDIASVSNAGIVRGIAVGSATILATIDGKRGSDAITVADDTVASISLAYRGIAMALRETLPVAVTVHSATGREISGRSAVWTSSDSQVVAIEKDGSVAAHKEGTASVTASVAGHTASAEVHVIAFTTIIAGSRDNCALTSTGVIYCAGMRVGALAKPVFPGIRWSQIEENSESEPIDASHICGITTGGDAMCWGSNENGQLGVGDLSDRASPVIVPLPERVVQLSLGAWHTCALTASGSIYCWGRNAFGQLGNGDVSGKTSPVRVVSAEIFTQVSAGLEQTCGLTAQGTILCWGRNVLGELGRGNWSDSASFLTPISVQSNLRFKSIKLKGSHSCALSLDGQAYCWGANTVYELGQISSTLCSGQHPCLTAPSRVSGSSTFTALATGGFGGCGLNSVQTVLCWGMDIQSALGSTVPVPTCNVVGATRGCTAIPLNGPSGFASLTGSERNYCGIRSDGGAYCWGGNLRGQLGAPSLTESGLPVVMSIDPSVSPP